MKKTNTGNIRKGFLFASLGSIGWGISGVCSQYLFTKYDLRADWLTAVRMLLSGLVLLLLVFRKEKMRTFTIWKNRKDVGQLLAFALFGLLMCQYTFLGAIKYSNSATATVLQSLNVIFMAVIVAIQSRTRMGIQQRWPSFSRLWAPFSLRQKAIRPGCSFQQPAWYSAFSPPQAWSSIHFYQGPSFLTGETCPSPDGACSSAASSCFWAQGHGSYRPILTLQHGS